MILAYTRIKTTSPLSYSERKLRIGFTTAARIV